MRDSSFDNQELLETLKVGQEHVVVVVVVSRATNSLPSPLQEHGESSSRGSSSEDSEENSEEASDLSDSELDADSYYFLQVKPSGRLCV